MIDYNDIENAAELINPHIVKTPLLESPLLNQTTNGRILFKAECLQRTGSFKLRGATNKLLSLNEKQRSQGIVAYSSGNHAQGVAAAARASGVSATIVIPQDAPRLKIENTRAYGAKIVLYDRYNESREEIAAEISQIEGRVIVPPYDDPKIIAGQATVGLEIIQQLSEKSLDAQLLLCPCGGGGLISGIASAVKHRRPDIDIFAVEPEGFDDTKRSLEMNDRVSNNPNARSICDAIVTPTPGEITFDINRRLLAGGIAVSDEAVKQAIKTAFTYLKLVVEPGAAVGLAAILSGVYPLNGRTAVVVLSGGNIDLDSFKEMLG